MQEELNSATADLAAAKHHLELAKKEAWALNVCCLHFVLTAREIFLATLHFSSHGKREQLLKIYVLHCLHGQSSCVHQSSEPPGKRNINPAEQERREHPLQPMQSCQAEVGGSCNLCLKSMY